MRSFPALEHHRRALEASLASTTSRGDRARMGQFSTPPDLASAIVRQSLSFLPQRDRIRFLDPAFGTGVFLSTLIGEIPVGRIARATAYELDPGVHQAASQLWHGTSLDLRWGDFTSVSPPLVEAEKPNLIICNPPYVRHELISHADKQRLRDLACGATGLRLPSRSGLHSYFLMLAHRWLAPGGVGGWLLPSWITEVAAGQAVREYLTDRVRLLRLHLLDPNETHFDGAAAAPMVVWFQKGEPPPGHRALVTDGEDLTHPTLRTELPLDALRQESKWAWLGGGGFPRHRSETTLDDLFVIKRGITTGANGFFVLTEQQTAELDLPLEFLRPLLPQPRYLKADEVCADQNGLPAVESRLFLLDCDLPMDEIDAHYPTLAYYLRCGEGLGERRRLCRERDPWYSQEKREPAPFLFTYMARPVEGGGRAFRFVLNHSRAVATNGYLMMYPRPEVEKAMREDPALKWGLWEALRAIPLAELVRQGRSYGRGLCKLEPRELGRVGVLVSSGPNRLFGIKPPSLRIIV